MKIAGLILAKRHSKRLTDKNILPFNGEPMFLTNVRKCLKLFDRVYVSSDDLEILENALKIGAIPIKRPKKLCGDTPNIPVYQHAIKQMTCDAFVAVQANSPTIKEGLIKEVKHLIERGWNEVMTCNPDYSIYGSLWGLSKKKLLEYGDPYKPKPYILIRDTSIDIHNKKDYENAINYNKKSK